MSKLPMSVKTLANMSGIRQRNILRLCEAFVLVFHHIEWSSRIPWSERVEVNIEILENGRGNLQLSLKFGGAATI